MSVVTRMDERIDELLFALRAAVEATILTKSDTLASWGDDQAWQHARKRLAELVEELLK